MGEARREEKKLLFLRLPLVVRWASLETSLTVLQLAEDNSLLLASSAQLSTGVGSLANVFVCELRRRLCVFSGEFLDSPASVLLC
ncbi:hypothetical protein CEXT_559691 [Caerostris extrusa]|uniref:Secreted protein n=1 Tax=Caerostris extrusa TaxID=172846 RepID=A0AAV4TLE0_CAEEX|nr:hypothetical protein CEXT_559691 [Caerostris extrusa]